MSHHNPNFSRNRGLSRGNWRTTTVPLPRTGANLLQIGGQTTSSRTRVIPELGSGLDSSIYAANCAPILGTQLPHCSQFCSSSQQPSAHLVVRNISARTWFPDTGANQHVTLDLGTLTDFALYLGNDYLHVGNSKGLDISHIGHIKLHSAKCMFILSNVLHVPHITKPLLSVKKLCLF